MSEQAYNGQYSDRGNCTGVAPARIVRTPVRSCGQVASGGNCTTADWGGSCPPGTTPDGYGMCCSTQVCHGETSFTEPLGEPTTAPYCGSPLLVDVAGDGFSLTDAEGGVLFDLNANGARGPLS